MLFPCLLNLLEADNLETTEDGGLPISSYMLSAKIIVTIFCTEVNRINHDYCTGEPEGGSPQAERKADTQH